MGNFRIRQNFDISADFRYKSMVSGEGYTRKPPKAIRMTHRHPTPD
jgi:hypothetical protein